MKNYSDNSVSKEQVEAIADTIAGMHATRTITEMDTKQNRQILELRILIGVSFLVNAALALALKFL